MFSQNFADKKYYLVDSLDLNTLKISDRTAIDSLLNEYHLEKEDSTKLDRLTTLVSLCENDIWISYNRLLMKRAEQLSQEHKGIKVYVKHISSAYNNLGFYFFSNNRVDEAIFNFEKSIELSRNIGDNDVVSTALNNVGYIYKRQGDILKALEYYHESLKLKKMLKDEEEVALALNNLGGIYYTLKEYDKALKYYRNALLLEKKSGTEKGVARLYNNIGSVYRKQQKPKLALDYYQQSIKNYEKIGYKKGEALSRLKYTSIKLEILEGNYPETLELLLEELLNTYNLFNEMDDLEGKARSGYEISNVYLRLGNVLKAEKYANESIIISKRIGFTESIKNAAKSLEEIAVLKNDFRNAYHMQTLFYKMQDSVENKTIKEVVIQKQYQYEYNKKMITDSLKSAENAKISEIKYTQEIKAQKLYSYIGIIGSVLLLIVVIVVLRGYQVKRKSNLELADKNKVIEEKSLEITDSITYAKRIQQAILPQHSEFKLALKKCFVFYEPKDIVAGDFYWMHKKEDAVLFAAADCTGHGVPGAMVSVICNNGLNRSVREYGLTDPGEILDKTREIVIQEFEKSEEEVKDGMDIALCSIKDGNLKYAGANNPLLIIRKGIILETKANKQPIGQFDNPEPYTTHSFKLEQGDSIYIFSDGYLDQFGGEKGKKFKAKAFKELLLSIQDESMESQKKIIDDTFKNWKGNLEQIDDVCVIGVRYDEC
ncbi:tetratricopeptide repeat protein [Vicingaceae bacterium]|nr:tetratricopeptide repeat protein [Vicingaceae bacterium]